MASKKAPKDRLLQTASEMFYKEGVSVGINDIIKRADVARMTLYKHFSSKEALILAVLEHDTEAWRSHLAERVDALARKPEDKPIAAFKVVEEAVGTKGFRGAAALNYASQTADAKSSVHTLARAHNEVVQGMFESWMKAAKLKKVKRVSRQLSILLNGALTTAQLEGDSSAVKDARVAAQALIAAAQ